MRRLCVWLVAGWLATGPGGAGGALTAEEETPGAPPAAAPGAAQPPAPVDMKRALSGRISLDFQDANLKDVLKLLSLQSGINFIAAENVKDRKITLFVDQVTVQDVLDQLLRANHLVSDTMPDSNILIIRETATGDGPPTVTKIYKLHYARLSTSFLARAVASGGRSSASGSGGLATTVIAAGGGSGGSSGGATGIDRVIEKLLTDGGSLVADERTNSLVITDVPDNYEKIERAIAALDVKTPQVLIEAELLEVSASKTKNLGIEWGGTAGKTGPTLATFTPATDATTRFPFTLFKSSGLLTSSQSRTITLGTLNSAQFQAVLKAIQNDLTARLLAHPKVLTLDNERALIELTADTAIGKQVATTATGGTGTTATTAERSPTGIKLQVTPQINADGYITMYVEPSLSRPVASEFFPSEFVDPKIRSVSTIVRVRDGETIVIGGLIDRQDTKGLRKVPGLGNVPLVGAAFKKTDDTLSDVELIVFITPRIVTEDAVDRASAGTQVPLHLPPLAPEQQPPGGAPAAREQTMTTTIEQMASSPQTTPR